MTYYAPSGAAEGERWARRRPMVGAMGYGSAAPPGLKTDNPDSLGFAAQAATATGACAWSAYRPGGSRRSEFQNSRPQNRSRMLMFCEIVSPAKYAPSSLRRY